MEVLQLNYCIFFGRMKKEKLAFVILLSVAHESEFDNFWILMRC